MKRPLRIIQLGFSDCGPACLQIILSLYRKRVPINTLQNGIHCGREGSSLLSISDVAEALGFHSQGVKLTWLQIREEAHLPCIVHWNRNHFIVVYKIAKPHGKWYVYVSDPAAGLLKYTEEAFLKSWLEIKASDGQPDKGVALLLEPTPTFYDQVADNKASGKTDRFTLKHLRPILTKLYK